MNAYDTPNERLKTCLEWQLGHNLVMDNVAGVRQKQCAPFWNIVQLPLHQHDISESTESMSR
jgi:hypothetical protein